MMNIEVPVPVSAPVLLPQVPQTVTLKSAVGNNFVTLNLAQARTMLKRMVSIRETFVDRNCFNDRDWSMIFGGVPGEAAEPFILHRKSLTAVIANEPKLRAFIKSFES